MWSRFRVMKSKKDIQLKECKRSVDVHEEYQGALRTKSYVDFFEKAQLLVHEPSMSPSYCHHKFTEVLLEPNQETITMILESASLSEISDLKGLVHNYFDVSAEASKICTKLLKRIIKIQANYRLFQQILNRVEDHPSHGKFSCTGNPNLYCSLIIHNNPFSSLNNQDFEVIHDKYSSNLQKMIRKRRKVARKVKMIKCFNKASGICLTAACGLVAIGAMALAAHTLTALVMGPMILSIPLKPLKKKVTKFQFIRSGFLRRIGEQLDVAMKGTYILNKDFDMMSRLVNRLQDDIERNRKMVELCLEKRDDRVCLQVLKELKKSDMFFMKQVDEVEEHVYLCLLTINRARALVMKELSTPCS